MKLQINTSGAWKQAITFWIEDVELVKQAAEALGEASASAGEDTKLRILDAQETVVLHWSLGKGWHVPHWVGKDYRWVP